MKIEGRETTTRSVQVDVYLPNVIKKLEEMYQRQQKVPRGAYINAQTGNWEDWTDTGHGSGLTDVIRPAKIGRAHV